MECRDGIITEGVAAAAVVAAASDGSGEGCCKGEGGFGIAAGFNEAVKDGRGEKELQWSRLWSLWVGLGVCPGPMWV